MCLASRAELERLGGFDEGLAHLDDWDMWLRLALAQPAGVCPEVLVAYVDHGAGRHITEPGSYSRTLNEWLGSNRGGGHARRSRVLTLDGGGPSSTG